MEFRLTEADNNKKITASLKDKVIVTLKWNPSTGYFWQDTTTSAAVLDQIKHDGSDVPGAPAVVQFIFKIINKGEITLAYARPWDETKPAKWWSVDVELAQQP